MRGDFQKNHDNYLDDWVPDVPIIEKRRYWIQSRTLIQEDERRTQFLSLDNGIAFTGLQVSATISETGCPASVD